MTCAIPALLRDLLHLLDRHAGAFQAVCAFLGLIGLICYCVLTQGIYKASLRQASAAIRPFIVIDRLSDTDEPSFRLSLLPISKKDIFIIRNLGNGPAMNIKWALGSDAGERKDVKWIGLGDLAVKDWSHIFDDSLLGQYMFDRPTQGVVFRFCDSAGTEFETTEEWKNGHFYQRCRTKVATDSSLTNY